jgi:hypothetical protein
MRNLLALDKISNCCAAPTNLDQVIVDINDTKTQSPQMESFSSPA